VLVLDGPDDAGDGLAARIRAATGARVWPARTVA
jgi:hypothetical protein